jgi:chemotaxis response regulator CheB
MTRIKVLVVDDSAVVRQVVTAMLEADAEIEVIGAAADPILAAARMQQQWPDVIVLDIEMPRMDGITFLKKIMAERPTPVVICSTLTEKGAQTSMAALAAGAVAIITKPKIGLKQFLTEASDDMLAVVKGAARANVRRLQVVAKNTADVILQAADNRSAMIQTTERVVALGTSTGGTQALEAVLTTLPRVCPGIVIVQHMPEKFTADVCQPAERPVPDRSEGSAERRPRGAGPCADRARRRAPAAAAQRRAVLCGGDGRPAGQPPPAFGGRAVPLGGQVRRRQRAGHHHDRHGRRRRRAA